MLHFLHNNKKKTEDIPQQVSPKTGSVVMVAPGNVMSLGAVPAGDKVNFAVRSRSAGRVWLELFRSGEKKPWRTIEIPRSYKVGDVWAVSVSGLDWKNLEYAYRMDGPSQPEKGLTFDKSKLLLDPYAKMVTGKETWGEGGSFVYRGRIVEDTFDWKGDVRPGFDISDQVVYELHTRFFTQHPSSKAACPGTFAAIQEKIPYLKKLGVNTIELLPIFQFDETLHRRTVNGKTLLESWGYNTVGFFAPNAAYLSEYQPGAEGDELKELVRELHRNNMEIMLDVVFNHTAEGNEEGPAFSFKGMDNDIYYLLGPDGSYHNYSGCGNAVNCNHPAVQQLILDSLRYWVVNYHIDGFRFDLASVLCRGEDGEPLADPPVVRAIACDPILSKTKLVGEVWDAVGLYQVGSFPANGRWAEWNGQYRDTVRGYLKGDIWESTAAARRIAGSEDLYSHGGYRGSRSSVNLLACHDGFTLHDIFAYNEKHNLANGWNNNDGTNDNRSWNCGEEGETEDPKVNALRRRMLRNAVTTLMCSRGTPLMLAGDEFGNSQKGNNNCYCQDNALSYLDWSLAEKNRDLVEFTRHMIAFRAKHPALRRPLKPVSDTMPEVQWGCAEDITKAPDNAPAIQLCFAGVDETGREDIVCLAVNGGHQPAELVLPELPAGRIWTVAVDTAAPEKISGKPLAKERYAMEERSVAVFTAQSDK